MEDCAQVGDSTEVEAGFVTPLGLFPNSIKASGGTNGVVTEMSFVTLDGTMGSVALLGAQGKLVSKSGESVNLVNGEANYLRSACWTLITG